MKKVKLGDLVTVMNEREDNPSQSKYDRFVGLEHYDSGSVSITRWGSTEMLVSAMKVFHRGDILVARRNVYLKRASSVDFDGITSGDSIILHVNDEQYKDIVPFVLNTDSFWDYADQHSDGSMSKRLAPKTMLEYEFTLPDDGEVERLSTLLWSMERTKTAYKNLIAKTEELVKSQFVEMIQSLLDTGETVPLGELVEADRPITYGILKPGTGFPGGVPVIKVKDMKDGFIDQTDLLLTSPEIDNSYKRSRLRAGDLLISIRGSVGRIAEVPENLANANITQDTARLTIRKEYNKVYIRGVLESEPLQHDMEKNTRGVAVKGINIGYLRELGIPVCERRKQDELASLYVQADKSKFAAQQALADLTATQKALMRQYLG